MRHRLCQLFMLLALLSPVAANAAGTTPLALAQEQDNTGSPLVGCLLYFFQAGTTASPQQVYSDFGLTQLLPNPLQCDGTGRVPMHWIADGLVHIRLTDASGVVQVDTTIQSLGPSSGSSGGGGSTVDPTSVASSGDIKVRMSSEVLTGWVILNGSTIGSASSGATQRANTDTQNLYTYLWQNCPNTHCPVTSGRGATALADFNAGKQIQVPDMRGRLPVGRDCMQNPSSTPCAGRLLLSQITSGGGDGVDTPGAWGGTSSQTTTTAIAQANLPTSLSGVTISSSSNIVTIPAGQGSHSHTVTEDYSVSNTAYSGGGANFFGFGNIVLTTSAATLPAMVGTINGTVGFPAFGSGTPATTATFNLMNPFELVTYYMKL